MKRKPLALTLILALLLLVGTQFVNFGMANPGLWLLGFPNTPVKTPPEIRLQSPTNNQIYDSNSLWLNFTIVKPQTWFFTANAQYISPNNYVYVNITSVNYTVDGIASESIPVHDAPALLVEQLPNRILDFSINLTLTEGNHNLTVNIQCDSYYKGEGFPAYPFNLPLNFSSRTVHFTIKTLTEIRVLSPEKTTYNSSDVILNFTVNKIVNSLSYILDGKDPVIINGNTTLTRLTNGPHNITVYAKDIFGNIENSETITFTIAEPEPFPTALAVCASGASMAIAGVVLLVYSKKHNH